MGKEWKFTQLGGAKRTLTLAGRAAPHGRPRSGAVVTDGIKLRRQRVYYPGNNIPTTHIFGTQLTDWELKGRFADKYLGKDVTKQTIRDWQTFVDDQQEVLISWGDVLSIRGFIDQFEPGRESEAECSYRIVALVDSIVGTSVFVGNVQPRPSPTSLSLDIQTELLEGVGRIPSLPHVGDLKPDFLDSLDELVSSLNQFSAALVNIAGEIDAFAEGTLDQLERLRAGAQQMKTAVNKIRGTFETTENDAALLFRSADSDVQWHVTRTSADVSTTRMLSLLEEIDREVELARRGRILAIYDAVIGDTWESIATKFYGGPQDAGAIRDANGVQYGQLPISANSYTIPVIG